MLIYIMSYKWHIQVAHVPRLLPSRPGRKEREKGTEKQMTHKDPRNEANQKWKRLGE